MLGARSLVMLKENVSDLSFLLENFIRDRFLYLQKEATFWLFTSLIGI